MRYLFTETEFQIFLSKCGAGKLYTFAMTKKPDDRSLAAGFADLLMDGRFVEQDDGTVELSPEMKSMADIIKNAIYVFHIIYKENTGHVRLVYTAGRKALAVVEREAILGNRIRIWKTDESQLIQTLIDSEPLSGLSKRDRHEAAELYDAAIEYADEGMETPLLTVQKRLKDNGDTVLTLCLMAGPLCQWIVIKSADREILRHVYSEEEFVEILTGEIERES